MEILSQMWSLLGLLTVLQNILPTQLLAWLHSLSDSLQDLLSPHAYFEIPEFNGYCAVDANHLYRHVTLYLNSAAASTCRRLTLSRSTSSNTISFSLAANHTITDSFRGHHVAWTHNVDPAQDSSEEKRSFTLKIPKRHRITLLRPYLEHVAARAEEFERVSRERRLYTNNGGHGSYESGWSSVPFHHPSTFDTLALEPELKSQLVDDLTSFSTGREFYQKTGRAWKRGYLLHGPPGSGKSSLIAAMANFLCYDVYDLELSKVADNSELRALLIQTTNRSIIVIEDIDCSINLTGDRSTKIIKRSSSTTKRPREGDVENRRVTLSGLLNFTDGLWSCCGEERVIVFTTNHRGAVDPALLRCGRMDVHVHLGTCGMHAVKALVRNYLGLESHALFDVAESCVRSGGGLTPAQIGEILLRNRRDADEAMKAVVSAMQEKILGIIEGGNVYEEVAKTPERLLEGCCGSPDNWSPERFGGKKIKEKMEKNGSWESKVKFLKRLKSLTKSESGRRGV